MTYCATSANQKSGPNVSVMLGTPTLLLCAVGLTVGQIYAEPIKTHAPMKDLTLFMS